jgi:RND family efflux transporter MFP subunit
MIPRFGRLARPLLCLAAVLCIGACRRAAEPVPDAAGTLTVSAQPARLDTLRDVANASGTVLPAAAADWTVFAGDFAAIVELPKALGEPVVTGEILVRLEIPALTQELSALELAVLDASARVDRAKAELTRQTSLFERGIVARTVYDNSRLELATAESGLALARTRLDAAKVAENRAEIRARFSGVVTEVFHVVGDQVRPGPEDPILRVVDPTRVQVAVELPLAQLARIVPGQAATVRAIAGLEAEAATVHSKSEATSASAPTGQVRLSFVSAATLPVNTPVSVEILLDQRTNVLVVPAPAVQRDDLGPYVWVVGDDQLAHRRDVRPGLTTETLVQIAAGLAAGEMVIVSGLNDVREGAAIVVAR